MSIVFYSLRAVSLARKLGEIEKKRATILLNFRANGPAHRLCFFETPKICSIHLISILLIIKSYIKRD